MHRPIATVFKVLGISIVLMLIMDMTFIAFDTYTVNSRVNTLGSVLEDTVIEHNCVPDDLRDFIDTQLKDVVNNSNVATDIISNIDRDITVGGVTHKAISEDNVREYGERVTIVVVVEMRPRSLMFFKDTKQNDGSFLGRGKFGYNQVFKYEVPALRTLK